MDEYISRKAVMDAYEEEQRRPGPWRFETLINSVPAANVAPVVHAEWVYDKNATDWGIGGYICSHCKNKNNNLPCNRVKSALMFSGARYCPNCGAKMDGGQHETD